MLFRSGYRGNALSVVDLWAALEDDDAHAHVRAAAARVLCLTAHDGVRARVDSTLGRVRDDSAAKRIRVAMEPDLEVASRELEALEQGVAPPPVSS